MEWTVLSVIVKYFHSKNVKKWSDICPRFQVPLPNNFITRELQVIHLFIQTDCFITDSDDILFSSLNYNLTIKFTSTDERQALCKPQYWVFLLKVQRLTALLIPGKGQREMGNWDPETAPPIIIGNWDLNIQSSTSTFHISPISTVSSWEMFYYNLKLFNYSLSGGVSQMNIFL